MKLRCVRGAGCGDGVACPHVYMSDRGTAVIQGERSGAMETGPEQGVVIVPGDLVPELRTQLGADVRSTGDGNLAVRGRRVVEPEALSDVLIGDGETLVELSPELSGVLVGQG